MAMSVTDALGDFMLKGWILTDKRCPTKGCTVPLMRSPNGRLPATEICVKCDLGHENSSSATSQSASSYESGTSTPPTEVSSVVNMEDLPIPAETEASRLRREQSDRAASEIGTRLLKGWAMLAEECPNQTCYGVPLVRPPRSDGQKDPKKECVICHNIYEAGRDEHGRDTLIRINAPGELTQTDQGRQEGHAAMQDFPIFPPTTSKPSQVLAPNTETSIIPSTDNDPLQLSASSLSLALQTLATRLSQQSTSSSAIDPQSMGVTAEAILKVTQALAQVKQLQWSERQAHASL